MGDVLVHVTLLQVWRHLCLGSRSAWPWFKAGLSLGVIQSKSLLPHLQSGNGHGIYLGDCHEVTAKNTWGTQCH